MSKKDVSQVFKRLRGKGHKIKQTKSGHWCVTTPNGPVFCSSTPSDKRALKNIVAMLRRKGVSAD